jgi:glutamate racemase
MGARDHPRPTHRTAMIGVFDSGVGGLGILGEVRRLLPGADVLYLADHARAPYGTRSLEEVRARCEEVTDLLAAEGCDVITIACNTASAAALHHLRALRPALAFVGMEPAVKPAAAATSSRRVGVVATAATFQGELFASVVDRFAAGIDVTTVPCPEWVRLVERGLVEGPTVESAVQRCLEPLRSAEVDVVVLACTHYPALRETIERVMGPGVTIIDPAPAVAAQTARVARARGAEQGSSVIRLTTTGDPAPLSSAGLRHGLAVAVSVLPLP